MYNRYVPQPDGSYCRNRVPEKTKPAAPPPPSPPEQTPPPCPSMPCYKKQNQKTGDFLRRLIPRDFDTGDLIVILLLLLMAGDCEEDRNNAILTIALYFLM